MRYRLSTLLLAVVLVAIAAAWFAGRRVPGPYTGYFSENGILPLIQKVDPLVEVRGVSGQNGRNQNQFTSQSTHSLICERPITEDFVKVLRQRLLHDLSEKGIKSEADLDASRTNGPWGFQVLFEEGRHRGVLTIRVMLKSASGAESKEHQAELFENIVVFPRD